LQEYYKLKEELEGAKTLIDIERAHNREVGTEYEKLKAIEQEHKKLNGELREEIQKKDKIIDKAIKELDSYHIYCPADAHDYSLNCEERCKLDIQYECWKMYFEKMIESEGN